MLKVLNALRRVNAWIAKLEAWSLVLILAAMMVLAFTQVILRNFFSTGLNWGDGMTRALVLWAGFFGASIAVNEGRYINIDAFSRLLGEKTKRWARGAIYLFAITVCFFLGVAAVGFLQMEKESGGMSSIGVQNWIIELVIPIVFFFLCFRFLLKLLSLFVGEPMEKQEWES